MWTAMICAAAVTAQFISGKATRDALFLTSLDFTALPAMLMATSVFSIMVVALNSRGLRRRLFRRGNPGRFRLWGAGIVEHVFDG